MDLQEQAKSRVAWQYREAEKFLAWIDTIPKIAQSEIEDVLERIAGLLDIDNATGAMLDVAGRIVNQGRTYREALDQNTKRWGAEGVSFGATDAYFTPTSKTIEQEAEDDLYRVLIKARIARNAGDATIDSIVRAVKFFVTADFVNVVDYENMSFDIVFKGDVTPAERFVVRTFDVVPRPQGVRLAGFFEPDISIRFGMETAMFGSSQFGTTYY